MARETIKISSIAIPEPQIVTIDSDSNEPTFPYGFVNQNSIVPPSFKDLNLPHNSFNVFATMAVIRRDEEYIPQSPEPSGLSPISTRSRNVSTTEGWQTPQTTTDDNTFYSEGEPRRVYWDISLDETINSNEPRQVYFLSSPSSAPPPLRRRKRKIEKWAWGCLFLKKGSVAAHVRSMRPALKAQKDTLMLRGKHKL